MSESTEREVDVSSFVNTFGQEYLSWASDATGTIQRPSPVKLCSFYGRNDSCCYASRIVLFEGRNGECSRCPLYLGEYQEKKPCHLSLSVPLESREKI